MSRTQMVVGALCLSVLAGNALAADPDNTVTNPSFENADPFFPTFPEGWADIAVGSPGWNSDYAQDGVMSIALGPPSSGTFTGWTTFLGDPDGPSGATYDPPYEFRGGDLYVSGWYLIPEDQPLAPDGVGPPLDLVTIKLEFRRGGTNQSIYQPFELPPIDVSTTDGQWVLYEQVFPDANISDEFPPYPERVSILPFRFDTGSGQMGTIYWDNFCVYQLSACICDLDGNDTLNLDDLDAFITAFLAGDTLADLDGNGSINLDDLDAFIACFLAGC